ncbi:MAG TPA: UDP-N-acetylmuramate dehydrogenase [Candidatus Saccharimonadales bacterium]
MDVHTNIPLKNYLTMKLGGNARFMAVASTPEEMAEICRNGKQQGLKVVVLGGGSNTLVSDEGFSGLVVRNQIRGIDIIEDTESSTTIKFGGGEIWDEAVAMTVERGLSGIEALSSIPGTVGAAPVQNIGAYGQELADTFLSLEAYDTEEDRFVSFDAEACGFSYRHSIFRGEAEGRYAITSVTLQLYKTSPQPPFYRALQDYFDKNNITIFTPKTVRDAVATIRADKLPDPTIKPNTGSFFKNAIVEDWRLNELLQEYPDMPHFDFGDKTYKVPTGWLIEQCGFKGQLLHGIRVNEKNCLVLINESATSFQDLEAARDEIIGKVRDTFRIAITQEPLMIEQ